MNTNLHNLTTEELRVIHDQQTIEIEQLMKKCHEQLPKTQKSMREAAELIRAKEIIDSSTYCQNICETFGEDFGKYLEVEND